MPKRPFLVTLLAITVLTLTIGNAVRLTGALASWDTLAEFASPPGPLYIALSGLFWALLGAVLCPALWFGWAWGRPAASLAGVVYILYDWADRLAFQSAVPNPNWPFAAVASLLWLALLFSALHLPPGRNFFTKRGKR